MNTNEGMYINNSGFFNEGHPEMAASIVTVTDMVQKKLSKKALWDENLEKLKTLYQVSLDEPLETYFKKTPDRLTFIKKMPTVIKIKLINAFFKIYDTQE